MTQAGLSGSDGPPRAVDGAVAGRAGAARAGGRRRARAHHRRRADPGAAAGADGAVAAARAGRPARRGRAPRGGGDRQGLAARRRRRAAAAAGRSSPASTCPGTRPAAPRWPPMSTSSTGWCRRSASSPGRGHELRVAADPRFDAIIAGARRRPAVLPMVQNAREGRWDGAGLAALLRDPAARARLLGQLEAMVAAAARRRHRLRLRGAAARRPARLSALPRRKRTAASPRAAGRSRRRPRSAMPTGICAPMPG